VSQSSIGPVVERGRVPLRQFEAAAAYDAAVHTVAERMSGDDGTGAALRVLEGLA